jgi:inosine-uridine nucleoside N-ribohydrolase
MKTKVLLDTDIGSDIDDAVCLAYLLAQPDCDLLGITTVTGDVVQRAMIASALCQAAGKNLPIYPGSANPLLIAQLQREVPQAAALKRWGHASDFPKGEAIEFLRRTIRQNPGEIVLLTIGPLTNIGLLFAQDPEIPHLLKSLVMMCGVFTNRFDVQGHTEWNAMLDPHASEIVYRAPVRVHRSIGLDVTMQTVLKAEEVRKRFQAPLLRPVLDFAEVWFEKTENMVFHDPLAATTIFDENVCTFERGNVRVDAQNEPGKTIWTADPDGRHEVALGVNPEHFFAHYFGTLGMI